VRQAVVAVVVLLALSIPSAAAPAGRVPFLDAYGSAFEPRTTFAAICPWEPARITPELLESRGVWLETVRTVEQGRLAYGDELVQVEVVYRRILIGIGLLCAGQALLIAWLLIHRARWKRAEEALKKSHGDIRDLSHRLVTAQEEERRRLARELHDDVTQRLARLAIDVGEFEKNLATKGGGETLQQVRQGLARLSEDVHALSYSLHPSVLEDLGLADALQVECDRFSMQSSIPVHLTERDLPGAIPREVSLCLFRVTQEALHNVQRHAQARSVEVSVNGHDGGIHLLVRDDGIGIDPAARVRPGLGLASMRERTRMLTGTLELDSRPGYGTALLAFIPLRQVRT
jgi:signal transduction histidine kinase